MKIFGDDYLTIVAETREQAEDFYKNEFGLESEDGLHEVLSTSRKIWFPLEELPNEYFNKTKYPRCALKDDKEMYYTAVEITLLEAMKFRKDKLPYCLSISGDLI